MSTSQPVLDATLLDFLTLATFDTIKYYKLSAAIERTFAGWQHKKWMQYSGRINDDGIFHGMGKQNAKVHCVIKISGAFAHTFYKWFLTLPQDMTSTLYATRIDLQRTKRHPAKEYRPTAYKRLKGKKSLITSDTGMTLYIGSRTSDTFWRLYDKTESALRCEVELKGRMAKRAWPALYNGESPGGIFNRVLLRSKVPNTYVEYFMADSEPAKLPELSEVVDMQAKLKWLATLDSLVYKLLADHDTGESTRQLLQRWTEYGQILDTAPENSILK